MSLPTPGGDAGHHSGRFNIRSMKVTSPVTVMKRFEPYADGRKTSLFSGRIALKKAVHLLSAVKRLDQRATKQALRPDCMVVTGHTDGSMRVRNFDTGEVVGECHHFNSSSVSCLAVTNSYIYTAVERHGKAASDDDRDVYVWDMTNLHNVHLTLQGHSDRVSCITVPPWNENTPVTGSVDKTIIVWDLTQGRLPRHILKGHTMMVKYILLSKRFIVSGSSDQSIRVWTWDGDSKSVVESAHQGPLQYMSFGPEPDTIISACGGGLVRETAVDDETGQLRSLWFSRPGKGQVLDVAFDRDYVASSSSDGGHIHVYCKGKKSSATYTPYDSSVRCLEIDPQRRLLLSGCDSGLVTVWDYAPLDEGKPLVALLQSRPHKSAILSIVLDVDSKGRWERLFTSAADNTLFTLDFNLNRDSYTKSIDHPVLACAEITPTGTFLTTDGNRVSVWNTTKQLHKSEYPSDINFDTTNLGYLEGHKDRVTGICFSEETMKVITVGADALMVVWGVSLYDEPGFDSEELIVKDDAFDLRGSASCLSKSFHEVIAVGITKTARGIVELMNVITGETIVHFSTASSPVEISLIGEKDVGITEILVQTLTELALFDMAGNRITDIVKGGAELRGMSPHLFWMDDHFSPPHGMVITCRDGMIKEQRIVLTGSKDLSEVKTSFVVEQRANVTCSALLRQHGMHCVVGTEACMFHVHDKTGNVKYTITWDGCTIDEDQVRPLKRRESFCDVTEEKLQAPATAVKAHLEGRYIAMGFRDGVTLIWDTANARVIQRYCPHDTRIASLHILPHTKRVVSVVDDALSMSLLRTLTQVGTKTHRDRRAAQQRRQR